MYTEQERDFDQQCQSIYKQKQLIQLFNDTRISSKVIPSGLQSSVNFRQPINSIQNYSSFDNNFSTYTFGGGGAINAIRSPSLAAININLNMLNNFTNLNQLNAISNPTHQNNATQSRRDLLLVRLFQKNSNIRKMVNQMSLTYDAIHKGLEKTVSNKNNFVNPNQYQNPIQDSQTMPNNHSAQFSLMPQPRIVIKQVAKIREKEEIHQVCNKLKVLVAKVKSIQSSKLEYTFQSYVQKMVEYFQQFEKDSLDAVQRQKKVCDLLLAIKKNFGIVNTKGLRYYKLHTSNYLLLGLYQKQKVQFFVNFYSQKLLFFQGQPIVTFPKDLLYCPIIVSRTNQYVKISEWYLETLNEIEPLWQYFHIKVCIFHKQISCIEPIFTSYLKLSQTNNKNQENLQKKLSGAQNYKLNKSLNQSASTEDVLLKVLKMIRNYVYQKMVFQWLGYIFTVDGDIDSDCCRYSMDIADNFRVQIRKEKGIHKNGFEQQFRSQLFSSLMTFINQKGHSNKSKYQLKQRLRAYFQGLLFNLIAQKSEYRVNFPSTYGSLSEIYFNYNKKSYIRHSVLRFLKQF